MKGVPMVLPALLVFAVLPTTTFAQAPESPGPCSVEVPWAQEEVEALGPLPSSTSPTTNSQAAISSWSRIDSIQNPGRSRLPEGRRSSWIKTWSRWAPWSIEPLACSCDQHLTPSIPTPPSPGTAG